MENSRVDQHLVLLPLYVRRPHASRRGSVRQQDLQSCHRPQQSTRHLLPGKQSSARLLNAQHGEEEDKRDRQRQTLEENATLFQIQRHSDSQPLLRTFLDVYGGGGCTR